MGKAEKLESSVKNELLGILAKPRVIAHFHDFQRAIDA